MAIGTITETVKALEYHRCAAQLSVEIGQRIEAKHIAGYVDLVRPMLEASEPSIPEAVKDRVKDACIDYNSEAHDAVQHPIHEFEQKQKSLTTTSAMNAVLNNMCQKAKLSACAAIDKTYSTCQHILDAVPKGSQQAVLNYIVKGINIVEGWIKNIGKWFSSLLDSVVDFIKHIYTAITHVYSDISHFVENAYSLITGLFR